MPLVDLPLRSSDDPAPRRTARAAILLSTLCLAFVVARSRPPAAVGADAPADRFSAARARATLERVLGDGSPHPAGSPAAEAFRQRLQAELRGLGLEPTVERAWACSPEGACADTVNLLARLPGGGDAPAVLLVAHTDSVAAGPGAADDGAGVVVLLETARALLAAPPGARPVALLFTDAEEAGLLGAQAFVDARGGGRLAREVDVVLNVEARGAAGLDHLFETGEENAGLIRQAGRALPRPSASSLFYEIYRRLPNDTDFSIFRRAGVAGLNFAFIGEPLRYHTPRDEPRLLDAGTLQHQGDHLLAAARALARVGSLAPGPGRRVFFDLLGFTLISWPEPWSLALAGAGLLLVLLAGGRRGALGVGGLALGLFALLLPVSLAAGAGWALHALLGRLGAFPYSWVADLTVPTLAFAALGALAAHASRLFRRVDAWSLWSGLWLGWGLAALALARLAPGASHLAIVPLLAAGLTGLVGSSDRSVSPGAVVVLAPLVAAATLWLPLAWTLPTAMGMVTLAGVAAIVALALSPAAGALAVVPAASAARALALVCVLGVVATLTLPRFTAERPQPASLRLVETAAESGATALWALDPPSTPLPDALGALAPFTRRTVMPWSRSESFTAPAPAAGLPPPELERLAESSAGDGRRLHLRLRSPRGATRAALWLPPEIDLRAARVAGVTLPAASGRLPGVPRRGRLLIVATLPAEGVEVELELGAQPGEAALLDASPGLPEAGKPLAAARGASAVPMGLGDSTWVIRKLML